MHFSTLVAAAFVGLAAAAPVSSDVEKRGVLIEVCLAGCSAACAVSPPVCAACLVGCLGTADDGGKVELDGAEGTPAKQ
ncbi:hypothetical protein LZ32DRAFT_696205 [Colletotrichum eremochloae]|nr:hypothetical protein LZ32DRAFT_696205 [Colletotrichum eremochloae]